MADKGAMTIVHTHADWDHIRGTGGLPREGARIIGHRACLERFDTGGQRLFGRTLPSCRICWTDARRSSPNH
ncbi:MAG: hypothetical protein KKC20_07455 [Proteobacteria bacterium]|nr:hypothetical protein [Pseudomonadota bacterium]